MAVIAKVIALVALAGCSSRAGSNAEPSGSAKSGISNAAVVAVDAPGSAGGRTFHIERQLPDAGWERAAEIVLTDLRPWAEKDPRYKRLVVKPLQAPDGSTLEHLLRYEAFTDRGLDFASAVLVADGKVIDKPEPKAVEGFLHERGFPAKRIERGLLFEALYRYGVVTIAWGSLPSQVGWDAMDRVDSTGGRRPVELAYDDSGATMTLLRLAEYNPHEKQRVDRFVIRFDASARMTITSAREQVDGSWKPIPPVP